MDLAPLDRLHVRQKAGVLILLGAFVGSISVERFPAHTELRYMQGRSLLSE